MASAGSRTACRDLRGLFAGGSVVGLEDGQLLARYEADRDEAAFEALVGRHGPMVLTTCRAVLRNEHDVEDAFQATFLVLARKAGSIRGDDALGGWLHRVAYRASVQASVEQARRRRKEAEAAIARQGASKPVPESEVVARLHEEIDRLPEGHRLAVVLCDLEGLTYEQAARQLRWTVPTLRNRLAKGRRKLKDRLTARGHVPLEPKPATAIVPPALLKAAMLAATGGPGSAVAAQLTHTILRRMLMTKIKIASTAALSALALATAGVIAAGVGLAAGLDPPPKPSTGAEAPDVAAEEQPGGKRPMEWVEVKGRVVAADGRPVAGSIVRGVFSNPDAVAWPRATSGVDGRFAIRLPKPGSGFGFRRGPEGWLIASAPGHGVGWNDRAMRVDRPDELVVTLAEEGPPIEGRIVDLEGRGVAGARVEATRLFFDEKGDLPGWIGKARNGSISSLWQGLSALGLEQRPNSIPPESREQISPILASTDADGRFKLTGIGRDRIAELIVIGPGVATTEAFVLSRAEPEIRIEDREMRKSEPLVVHAPRFQLALMPSKRVEGVARDKDTGLPIAGVEVNAAVFDQDLVPARGVESWTDAEGRYRLDGLPRAAEYKLFAEPKAGVPYLNATFRAPADSPGLEPASFDLTLKRGVVVRGRLTDQVTGRPIRGLVYYYAFEDNPLLADYPGFSRGNDHYVQLDKDGRYEIVAPPGRGLIVARDIEDRYLMASGYEGIRGYEPESRSFRTVPHRFSPVYHAVVVEVEVDPRSESVTLDLRADPGRSVMVEVVGPDGVPLVGTKVKGMNEMFQTNPMPQESAGFEVRALAPGKHRRVVVTHEGRKLIGSALLKGDEPGPVTIKLAPWGSVTGRLVDGEGRPLKGMSVGHPDFSINKHPETHDILESVNVGDDGRFLVEGLVPGLRYDADSRTGPSVIGDDLFKDLTVDPGEAKDLGDLKVKLSEP